jgi:hypothetical protein
MTTTKEIRQRVQTTVGNISIDFDLAYDEAHEPLALKMIEQMRTAITGPAAQQNLTPRGWDIRITTTEHSRSGLTAPDPALIVAFAGRNYDIEEGA